LISRTPILGKLAVLATVFLDTPFLGRYISEITLSEHHNLSIMTEQSQAAGKERIISHMNKDHQDSLMRYLQVYCHVSAADASSAQMSDITRTEMAITSNRIGYVVPLEPPLESLL